MVAEREHVQPFLQMFEKLFVWLPGEYVFELKVNALERAIKRIQSCLHRRHTAWWCVSGFIFVRLREMVHI